MTDVLAYSARADEAKVDDDVLLRKLDVTPQRLFLLLGAFLSGRQRQHRPLAASDQRAYARHCRSLPRTAGGSRRRVAIVRSLPLAGRSRGENLREKRRARRVGWRRQGRLIRSPALAQRRKVDLVWRPLF